MQNAVKEWHTEDEIKAQLRDLTEQTRKLRQDLDAMVRPEPSSPSRRLIHRQSWPKQATVNDRRGKKPR